MTRQEFEAALDDGLLAIQASNGKWYRCRRNGQTKVWKTQHDNLGAPRFETPIKWAFRSCTTVENKTLTNGLLRVEI